MKEEINKTFKSPEFVDGTKEELNWHKLIVREKSILSHFREKAGRAARILALITTLFAGSLIFEKDTGLKFPENTPGEMSKDRDEQLPEQKQSPLEQSLKDKGAYYLKLAEIAPAMALDHIADFKNEPNAKEILLKLSDDILAGIFLNRLGEFIDQPYAEEIIEELTRRDPYYILDFAHIFVDKPFAERIVRKAAMANPRKMLENGNTFKNIPWAEEIIKKITDRSPVDAIARFKFYQECDGALDILHRAVDKIKITEPYIILNEAPAIIHFPFVNQAVKDIVSKNSEYALSYFRIYAAQPYADEVLKKALQSLSNSATGASIVLSNVGQFKNRTEIEEYIKIAAENNPEAAVDNMQKILSFPHSEAIITRAIERSIKTHPGTIIYNYIDFKHFKKADLILEEAVQYALENEPETAIYLFYRYKHLAKSAEFLEIATKKVLSQKPLVILMNAGWLKAYKFGEESIKIAAQKLPWEALINYQRFADQPYFPDIFEKSAEIYPDLAEKCLFLSDQLKEKFKSSKNEVIQALLAINKFEDQTDQTDRSLLKEKIATLIHLVVKEKMPLEKVAEIAADQNEFIEQIFQLSKKGDVLGRGSIENNLREKMLGVVYKINNLHNEPDEKRFESLQNASPDYLYALMVFGEEEIFTSTFNGCFDRMIAKMKERKISGDVLLNEVGWLKFRSFIKLTANFNRLNDFLKTMDEIKQKELLHRFVAGIDQEKNKLNEAVIVADIFSVIDDKKILAEMQATIKREYERIQRTGNQEDAAIYGLLAGLFGQKIIIDEKWMREILKEYKLPDILEIKSKDLFNPDGTNIQQYFFYNDEDGHRSFLSFLNQYRNKAGWEIQEHNDYVLVKSTDGRKIEIYANKPLKEYEGSKKIEEVLKKRKIEPIVVVHRGHSYHAPSTIERIPRIAKIVSLGSCGGYQNISAVLERAPKAHIISTKGKGTRSVNDPVLKNLNEKIKSGHNINWPQFWRAQEKRFGLKNEDFKNYVPPHKNLGALFLKAYQQLSKK